jgi:hypothetical protein
LFDRKEKFLVATTDVNNRDADAWLEMLQAAGVNDPFDLALAETLRIAASVRDDAVCLCSGPAVLPYVHWIRDGLPMTGRVIVHLDPSHETLMDVVQTQPDSDIRVASHFQEIASFCDDISHHKLNLIVIDIDDDDTIRCVPALTGLLTSSSIMVCLLKEGAEEVLRNDFSTDFFFAPIGSQGRALMIAKKGMQHHLERRSRRRNRKG